VEVHLALRRARREILSANAALEERVAQRTEEIERLRAMLEIENDFLRQEVREAQSYGELMGSSAALRHVAQQIDMLQAELDKSPDALCFAALDSQAANPLLQKAQEAGIPVVAFDSGVDSDIPITTAATDNVAAAALAADKMAELIGDEGKVGVIVHDQTSRTGIDRSEGFVNRMAEAHPNVEIIGPQYGAGDQLKSTDLAKATFQWTYLDAGWAQYNTKKGDIGKYLSAQVASAKAEGLGLVAGLNAEDASGVNTAPMTASQIKEFGSTLASSPAVCALAVWKYDAAYLAQTGIRAAFDAVASLAKSRAAGSCVVN